MRYEWLDEYCLAKKGATKDYKAEWDAERYMVGGKMFLMVGENKEGAPILTLRLEPPFGELMREKYECVTPGYYMNKTHWNSVLRAGDVPDEEMQGFIDDSYRLIFGGLTKKAQNEILNA